MRCQIKTFFTLASAITVISLIYSPALRAAEIVQTQDATAESLLGQISTTASQTATAASTSSNYLQVIASNTTGMLSDLSTLPATLQSLGQYILSWMNPDTSDITTSVLFPAFNGMQSDLSATLTAQNNMQQQLNSSLFGAAPPANVAALTYSSLLGLGSGTAANPPPASPQYSYILNASGMNLQHAAPKNWTGDQSDRQLYQSYYNTVMAASSFGGYVLSGQYVEAQAGNQFTTLQQQLLSQAAGSQTTAGWLAQFASENLGVVLKQILMFQSQIFVLLTQSIQLQKQMVTAQVMTNALLIANNQINEGMLLRNAQGVAQ